MDVGHGSPFGCVDYNDHRIPDPLTDDPMLHLDGHPRTVQSLAFSPDSTLLASGAKDGGLRLWGVCGELVKAVTGSTLAERRAICWHPSGETFAVTDRFQFATVSADGSQLTAHQFVGLKSPVSAVAYLSPLLAVIGTGGTAAATVGAVYLWDVTAKKPRPMKRLEPDGVRAVAVHPATKLVAWLTANRLSLWDITRPTPKTIPLGNPGTAVSLSPDGKHAAVAVGWNVRAFDTTRDAERETLRGHKGQVSSVAFTTDGRTLVTGGWDETVRLWDVPTGRETACFDLAIGKVNAIAVSPDGTRLAAGSLDGRLALFDLV